MMVDEIKDKEGKVVAELGNEDEVLWTTIINNTESRLKGMNDAIKVDTEVLELAKRKLKEAKDLNK